MCDYNFITTLHNSAVYVHLDGIKFILLIPISQSFLYTPNKKMVVLGGLGFVSVLGSCSCWFYKPSGISLLIWKNRHLIVVPYLSEMP